MDEKNPQMNRGRKKGAQKEEKGRTRDGKQQEEIHCVNCSLDHKKICCSSEKQTSCLERWWLMDGWLDQWTCRDDRKKLKHKCNESLRSSSLMIAVSLWQTPWRGCCKSQRGWMDEWIYWHKIRIFGTWKMQWKTTQHNHRPIFLTERQVGFQWLEWMQC